MRKMARMTMPLTVLMLMAAPSLAAQDGGEQALDCKTMLEQVAAQAQESKPAEDKAKALDELLAKAQQQAAAGDEEGCRATAGEMKKLLGGE